MNKMAYGDNKVPVVSVVMPVYNGQLYLAESLESILGQTFTNFELIVIDDGSTDLSLEILKKFEKRDARIRLVARENRNLATTLNDCIELARGEWIARMDQDDIALPHRLERQLQWLQETRTDICGSWAKMFGTPDERIIKHAQSDAAIRMELLFGSAFVHPSVMMRAALVKTLRYDKAWEKAEDYDLWERVARAGYVMTNVPEVLLLYRQHETQISTMTSFKQQELTQQIRLRYWGAICDAVELEQILANEVLKLREPLLPAFDMNKIDAAFLKLLEFCHDEAREVVFDHMTRLYFRAAGSCRNIEARWSRLNKRYGNGAAWGIRLKLRTLSFLRVEGDSPWFMRLKQFYFRLTRST